MSVLQSYTILSSDIRSIKGWLVEMQDAVIKDGADMQDSTQSTVLRNSILIWRMLKGIQGEKP